MANTTCLRCDNQFKTAKEAVRSLLCVIPLGTFIAHALENKRYTYEEWERIKMQRGEIPVTPVDTTELSEMVRKAYRS